MDRRDQRSREKTIQELIKLQKLRFFLPLAEVLAWSAFLVTVITCVTWVLGLTYMAYMSRTYNPAFVVELPAWILLVGLVGTFIMGYTFISTLRPFYNIANGIRQLRKTGKPFNVNMFSHFKTYSTGSILDICVTYITKTVRRKGESKTNDPTTN